MTVVAAIVAIGLLIVFHELGHYVFARLSGMKVERFSVGFGPVLLSRQIGETEWALSAVPFGGYVKIAGMDPSEAQDDPRAYNNKPNWQRLLVIAAGPMANYLLAAILFAIVLAAGPMVPDTDTTRLGHVVPGHPAEEAGVQRGDTVLSVNGQPVSSWQDLQEAIHARPGQETVIEVARNGEQIELAVVPEAAELEDGREVGQIGVMPEGKRAPGQPLGEAVAGGFSQTWEWNLLIFDALGDLVREPDTQDLRGPVGIVQETGRAAEEGVVPLLILAAVISVHLALFNLLPIPALDGGRLVFLLAEVVRRKPVNARIELAVHAIGFLLLLSLIVVVTFQDVGRLFE